MLACPHKLANVQIGCLGFGLAQVCLHWPPPPPPVGAPLSRATLALWCVPVSAFSDSARKLVQQVGPGTHASGWPPRTRTRRVGRPTCGWNVPPSCGWGEGGWMGVARRLLARNAKAATPRYFAGITPLGRGGRHTHAATPGTGVCRRRCHGGDVAGHAL